MKLIEVNELNTILISNYLKFGINRLEKHIYFYLTQRLQTYRSIFHRL